MHTNEQRGSVGVEFMLAFLFFMATMFAVIEYARMMYLWNSQQEVTRRAARAAAVTNFSDTVAMQVLRRRAIFRDSDGALPLAPALTQDSVRIEYLSLGADGAMAPIAVLPGCPARNVLNCAIDPHGVDCIRLIRVSVCGDSNCSPIPYQAMMPLVPVPASLPPATTVLRAESLGFRPGQAMCP